MKKKIAIILDLDNTLLYQTNRNPFNWSDLSGDIIIPEMNFLIDMIMDSHDNPDIIIVTGRPEEVRPQTEIWLMDNDVPYKKLYMKQGDPMGKSAPHKEACLKEIKEDYDTIIAFEDDNKCAKMYIENGVFTLMPLNYKVEHRKLKEPELKFPE